MKHLGLQSWIAFCGGLDCTAKILGVSRQRVYAWQHGVAKPNAKMAYEIVKASKGRVTWESLLASLEPVKSKRTRR